MTFLRKSHPTLVSFVFRVPGLEFENSSEINLSRFSSDIVVRQILPCLASETFFSGLQKKSIETP